MYICYKGTIFVSEIKQNTNSTDPRRSLKSATKIMKNLFNTIDFEALNGNAVLDDGRTIDSARVEQAESDKAACLDAAEKGDLDRYLPIPWRKLYCAEYYLGSSDSIYTDNEDMMLELACTITDAYVGPLTLDELDEDEREEVLERFCDEDLNEDLGKNRLFKIDTREIEGQGYLLLEK